jgi:hypothetical protein
MRPILQALVEDHLHSAPRGAPYESWRLILVSPQGAAQEHVLSIDQAYRTAPDFELGEVLWKDLRSALQSLLFRLSR